MIDLNDIPTHDDYVERLADILISSKRIDPSPDVANTIARVVIGYAIPELLEDPRLRATCVRATRLHEYGTLEEEVGHVLDAAAATLRNRS